MKRQRGFSLVELMVVVAMVGIVAAAAFASMRAITRNASVGGTTFEYKVSLSGLQSKALAEQRTLVAIFVADDGAGCTIVHSEGCTRYFLVADPDPAAWTFAAFDPANPGLNVSEVIARDVLPNGVFLSAAATGRMGPRPFHNVQVFDPNYLGICGTARCVAFRFRPSGEVEGELRPGGVRGRGNAIAFASDLEGMTGAAERRILLVGFPNGITKSYAY